eukprot:TRINITY_DN1120_c0_g1_i1.p1 TRINITY_DN1120_c0_g1~~TRINITY_DN1120_c0_g1_i1.p1  ORF type:complete len:216 (-),score=46.87 TRINITY_DN1120_c0_g1_i1:185-787(-)
MAKAEGPKVREVKLVLLGDVGVGKSSLVLQFVANTFNPYAEPTIGASFMTKTLAVDDTTVKFQIWDTAGQERYRGLAPMYYRGAAAAIVVYDITQKSSFQTLQRWVKELRTLGPENIVIAIAANKADLEDTREVDTETGRQYAQEIGGHFCETSAKTNQNVTQLFTEIAKHLPQETQPARRAQIQVSDTAGKDQKKKCCS